MLNACPASAMDHQQTTPGIFNALCAAKSRDGKNTARSSRAALAQLAEAFAQQDPSKWFKDGRDVPDTLPGKGKISSI